MDSLQDVTLPKRSEIRGHTGKSFALIGFGAIGRAVFTHFQTAGHADRIVGILVREGRADSLRKEGIEAVESFDALMSCGPETVVEVAGQGALESYGAAALEARADLLVTSIGALGDDRLFTQLQNAALQANRQILLPAGAIGGIDAIAAMRLAKLTRVTYRSRKPPGAWQGTPADGLVDLASLQEPTTFFRGNAREAARQYPKNANVTATLALAGLGFDRTDVELIADPTVTQNVHEIEAEGSSGSVELRFKGHPLPGNPRTSALTVLSVIRTLDNIDAAIVV